MEIKKQQLDYYENKEYVSNSMLGALYKSPAYFLAYKNGNIEKKESLSLEKGSLLHLYILEPHKFVVANVEPVTGKMGKFIEVYAKTGDTDHAYNAAEFKLSKESIIEKLNEPANRDYLLYLQESNDKIAISEATHTILKNCKESLCNNRVIYKYLFECPADTEEYNEHEIYVDDLEGFGKAKGKIDRLLLDRSKKTAINIDLKSTSESVYSKLVPITTEFTHIPQVDFYTSGFAKSYIKYQYYRQQAFYEMLIRKAYDVTAVTSLIVAVEMSGLFETTLYKQSDYFRYVGFKELKELSKIFSKCCIGTANTVPTGYEEDNLPYIL